MRTLLSTLFLLIFLSATAQMTPKYGSFENIPYVFWDGPGTDMVVVAQGSGEYSTSLTAVNMNNINANSYAQYAKAGIVFDFDILVAQSYKGTGMSGNPSQVYLKKSLSRLIKTFNPSSVTGTGYSFGGQLMAGFMTASKNSNDISSGYIGHEIFDGFIIMCGQAPGISDWYIHKNKPRLIIHGTSDSAVKIGNGIKIMNESNKARCSKYVFPDYLNIDGTWTIEEVPDSATSKMKVIINGSHSSSWSKGYNYNDPIGKEAITFIQKIAISKRPKPFVCKALLDTINKTAIFTLPDSTLYKATIIKQ